jgi:hypothetical protein
LSSEHWKPAPGSLEVYVNEAEVLLVGPVGPPVRVVSGASVSTVQVLVAGEASTLPAVSRATTWKVWEPWESPV